MTAIKQNDFAVDDMTFMITRSCRQILSQMIFGIKFELFCGQCHKNYFLFIP